MPRILLTILIMITVMASVAPCHAQFAKNKITYVNFEWRLYDTEHFNIYFYRGAEELLKEIAVVAEQAYEHHRQALNFDLPSRVPFVMYRNQREFQQTNILLSEISEGVGGFSEILHNRMVLPVDGPREKVRRLIYHELTHIFQYEIIFHSTISQAFANVPDWFMEGMAAHMEGTWDAVGLMVLRDAVLNGTVPRLSELHNFNYISNPFLGYRFGQSAMDYLVLQYGYKGLQRLLWELSKSKTKNFKDIIKKALDIPYKDFDDKWQVFMKERFWIVGVEGEAPSSKGTLLPHDDFTTYQTGQYFQTALSPSGDILAVISTERGELDINLLTADKGKLLDNLTKNYQGTKYELLLGYSSDHGRNIAWAPDGSVLAFAAKKEGENVLLFMNPLSGTIVSEVRTELNNLSSPSFSADTRQVAFSADDDRGQSDIFLYNRDTKEIQRITDDNFVDTFPAFRPDGQALVYCSERGEFAQLVLLESFPAGKALQMTAQDFNHSAPAWSANGRKIIFIADKNLIMNMYELDLELHVIRQLTDTYAGFNMPQYSPDGTKIYFETYYRSSFHTGYMDYPTDLESEYVSDFVLPTSTTAGPEDESNTAPEDSDNKNDATNEQDLIAFLEGDSGPDTIEGKKVNFKLLPDAGEAITGYRSDGIFYAAGYLYFSDILGDHRFVLQLETIQDDSSIGLTYFNLKNRINWGVLVSDFRDVTYYVEPNSNDLKQYKIEQYGMSVYAEYPFNRYHRLELSSSRYRYTLEGFPVYNYADNSYDVMSDVALDLFDLQSDFVRDTIRYRYFGPYQGSAVRVGVSRGIPLGDSYFDFTEYNYDLRAYQRLSPRTLWAFRVAGVFSSGEDQRVFAIGGGSTVRGYKYNELVGNNIAMANIEFRFPLVDIIRISFLGSITNIRGAFYWDFGAAWFEDQDVTFWEHTREDGFHFVDLKSAQGFGIYWNLGYFELRFDWARKTNFNEFLGDTVYQFSIGRSF